jgi:chemotaxis protein histidine kinase CheA
VEKSAQSGSLIRGQELYTFLGRARLDHAAVKIRKRFPRNLVFRFFVISFFLHSVFLFISDLQKSIEPEGPACEYRISVQVASYNLEGESSEKWAEDPYEDFEKGLMPESPGLMDDLLADEIMQAEEAAETNPDELAEMDAAPGATDEDEPSPESAPSEPCPETAAADAYARPEPASADSSEPSAETVSADADKAAEEPPEKEPVEETSVEKEYTEGPLPDEQPLIEVTEASATETLSEKLARLGHSESKPADERTKVTFEPSDPQEAQGASTASKPRDWSYTTWKKYLQASAVIGLPGGKGAKGAVNPGGGRPEFFGTPLTVTGKRVVFVIDYSASMNMSTPAFADLDGTPVKGNKFDRARTELKRTIASLKKDVRFTILFFNHKYRLWKPMLLAATDANKDDAFAFISGFKPDKQTDITTAVLAGLGLAGEKGVLVLLTDGAPNAFQDTHNEPDAARKSAERIAKANKNRIPIQAFGFFHENMKAVGQKFLKRVAANSGGSYREVE